MASARLTQGLTTHLSFDRGPDEGGGDGADHPGWARVPIARIEDLEDAVLGAGLDAVQLSPAPIAGSLLFAQDEDITFGSGFVQGHVALTGPLSETMVTLGLGLHLAPGSRQWLQDVSTGGIGVFFPGDTHEAIYGSGSLYATATLSLDRLEELAAREDLVLDARQLGGSGICHHGLQERKTTLLKQRFAELHQGRLDPQSADALGRRFLTALIEHLAREPSRKSEHSAAAQHRRIVERARQFIVAHLDMPLSIEAISEAAFASRRTLHRAFVEVLGETPQSYVRKLRLNRIRHDLATESEARCTITIIANRWGISELGRLSGWYRELFGELPSQTVPKPQEPKVMLLP